MKIEIKRQGRGSKWLFTVYYEFSNSVDTAQHFNEVMN